MAAGDGTDLTAVVLPVDYHVVLVVPHSETKPSTAAVYEAFDVRRGANGFEERATAFHRALESISDSRPGQPSGQRSRLRRSRARSATPGHFAPTSRVPARSSTAPSSGRRTLRASPRSLTQVGRTLVTRPLEAVDLP